MYDKFLWLDLSLSILRSLCYLLLENSLGSGLSLFSLDFESRLSINELF